MAYFIKGLQIYNVTSAQTQALKNCGFRWCFKDNRFESRKRQVDLAPAQPLFTQALEVEAYGGD